VLRPLDGGDDASVVQDAIYAIAGAGARNTSSISTAPPSPVIASSVRRFMICPGAARPDRQHGPPAGEARSSRRLAVSRGAVRSGLFGRSGSSAAADAAHGGPFDLEGNARPFGRGFVRALGREPVLSAVLRRGVLPAQDALIAALLVAASDVNFASHADPRRQIVASNPQPTATSRSTY
jgi:hypothetical protein